MKIRIFITAYLDSISKGQKPKAVIIKSQSSIKQKPNIVSNQKLK